MKKIVFLILLIPSICLAANPVLQHWFNISASSTNYLNDANIQAAYYMNGTSGETDRSGNGENLTAGTGTPAQSSTVPAGYSGYSRIFVKVQNDSLVGVADGSTDISGADQPISFGAWINLQSDVEGWFIAKYTVSGNQRQYGVRYDETGNVINAYISNDGTAFGKAIGATTINTSTWHHVTVVYNDTDIRIYINGSLDSNGADNPKAFTSGIYASSAIFYVGDQSGAGIEFNGYIDEPFVFDRALSAAEVLEIYNYGLDKKGAND